jgi:RecA-family ATPase
MSAQPRPSKRITLQPLRPRQLADASPIRQSWLWHGYLAHGRITTLISPPKSGKTTLASRLFARFEKGGQLAGLDVAAARALVISEESSADWDARCRQLALGDHLQFLCRPFQGARPTDAQWLDFLASLEDLYRNEHFDLIVIDALATLLPGYAETCAPKMLDCLLPLQALANLGPAIWLLHHPAKSKRPDGQTARGSGALTGFADIVMEMTYVRRARGRDRRRRLSAYSRYAETPRQLILELTEDALDSTRTSSTPGPK